MKDFDLSLYLVTDRECLGGRDFLLCLEEALVGGVTLVQLREKNLTSRAYYELALQAKGVCAKYKVPLIINDRADIALAVGGCGLHIGQEDLPFTVARKMLGEQAIIGVTVHNEQEALAAFADGADYLGAGCVYGTVTKQDTVSIGLAGLKKICQAVSIPVVGIGGVKLANAAELIKNGAAGAAVVTGILAQQDISAATRELLGSVRSAQGCGVQDER